MTAANISCITSELFFPIMDNNEETNGSKLICFHAFLCKRFVPPRGGCPPEDKWQWDVNTMLSHLTVEIIRSCECTSGLRGQVLVSLPTNQLTQLIDWADRKSLAELGYKKNQWETPHSLAEVSPSLFHLPLPQWSFHFSLVSVSPHLFLSQCFLH